MGAWKALARGAGLALCVLVFAATALADPGNGNGNGNGGTPPGQEKKAEPPAAETPAPAAAPAPAPAPAAAPQAALNQEKQAEKRAEKTERKAVPVPSKSAKAEPAQQKKAEKNAEKAVERVEKKRVTTKTASKGRSAEAHHHVIICHRTGSDSNPYVVINIPLTAWHEAHSPDTGAHPDRNGRHDILLKDPASRPGSKDGFTKSDCASRSSTATPPAPSVTPAAPRPTGTCPQGTTTERVLVGVWHATGAYKNGKRKYVFIKPNATSAHYSKHADDIPVHETRTVTASSSPQSCTSVAATTSTPQPQPLSSVAPGTTPAVVTAGVRPKPTTDVRKRPTVKVTGEKATAAPKKEQRSSEVLGAVASAPRAVTRTAATETLPFTGIPLWIVALLGGGLLLTGIVFRRHS